MAQEPQTFENKHIQLSVERHPGCRVNMTITTLPIATQAAKLAAIKEVGKVANIPGFRKGKAPEALIAQKFPTQIDRELREIILRNSLQEAMQLSSLQPYSKDAPFKLIKCEPIDDSSYLIKVEFETYPEVPAIDFSTLSAPHIHPGSVKDEDIEKKIEELREYHTTWEDIADRPAEEGDYVLIDIDLVEGEPISIRKDSRFHMIEGKFPSWCRNLTIGLREGEQKEGFTSPESEEKAADFQPKKCRITLKKIQKPHLPNVDDELAKKAGTKTVDELRQSIAKSLARSAEQKALQETRFEMKKTLLDQCSFDIPHERINNIKEESQAYAEEQFENVSERQNHADKLFADGVQNLRFSYLISRLMRDYNLSLPDTNLVRQRATEHMVMHYMGGNPELEKEEIQRLYQMTESELLAEHILDFVLEKCKKS